MLTKILIVEDDVALLDSLSKYLVKNGFQTRRVSETMTQLREELHSRS